MLLELYRPMFIICWISITQAVNANTDVSAAVLIGSTVTFSCSVNDSTKIVWESTDAISVKNELVTKFAERYSVKHMNGKTDLIIKNIQHCDAGSYRCRFFKNDEERKCEFLLITMGSPVVCDMNSPKVNECSCHVRHSNDTVPHFNCSRKLSYMVLNTMSIRQTGDICPLKDKTYNITTLTLNGKDLDKPLGCDVSYCLPNDSSHVYLTEHFVIPRRVQVSDVQDTTLSSPTTADEARPTPVNVILLSVVCVAVLLTVVFGAITVLHLAKKAKPSRRAVENETAQPDLNEELDTINHAGNFGRRTPYVPAAADDTGSSTESTDLTEETSVDKSVPALVFRDIPSLQQQQQQPRDDDVDGEEPQYAELASSGRRSDDHVRVVNNSTAVYADIVHFRRPQQP